ncbi:MAG: NADH:flavin oxidoreductase [Synergistaceae bacterium]|jgi:2,4-dienoyl-CoA reductase-like NADH-dependent reductase (Old Yellow Enzyme family)|nr:NADH:flavin oxidoreductase [Synergistaceae bacterium]
MKKIFDSIKLGQLSVKNRAVRSATFERNGGENGVITPRLKERYEALASGGVGVIITGMMGIGGNSCLNKVMPKIYLEEFTEKFKEAAEAAHKFGAKVIVQLGHCGAKSTDIDRGDHPYAPSDIEAIPGKPAKALLKEEIRHLTAEFGASAAKCRSAGADGVQLHGAHGYLISQFLSPCFNKREDEYGGSVENRARFLFEAYDEVRTQVGPEYPVWVKINYSDLAEGGLSGGDCLQTCRELERRGIDAIEISSGLVPNQTASQPVKSEDDEGYLAEGALKISSEIGTPIISVGGYRTPSVIEDFLNKGNIEAISLCRPFICEPGLLNRWAAGDGTKARCVSCNRCYLSPNLECVLNQ